MTRIEAQKLAQAKFPIQNPNCRLEVELAQKARKAYVEKLLKGLVKN